ncbi:hypothetical protein [Nocardioides sp. AE5]|uniref:hypothetical protein n=1 Tax=Nocardioides sp. AE5 TaxID=2962573 RepID=UPI0028819F67|nr:hypothetical protein [Nocardioides sp. AE5]MDT0203714.1 hypothetical protein [Nocardioides sp. AE5]
MAAKGLDAFKSIDPRQLKTPMQRVFGAITLVGIIMVAIASIASNASAANERRTLPECRETVTADCIEVAPGVYSTTGQEETSRYFAREGERREKIKVSLSPNQSRELRSQADGLYVDGDLIGLQDRDGERYWSRERKLSLEMPWTIVFGIGVVLVLGGGLATAKSLKDAASA